MSGSILLTQKDGAIHFDGFPQSWQAPIPLVSQETMRNAEMPQDKWGNDAMDGVCVCVCSLPLYTWEVRKLPAVFRTATKGNQPYIFFFRYVTNCTKSDDGNILLSRKSITPIVTPAVYVKQHVSIKMYHCSIFKIFIKHIKIPRSTFCPLEVCNSITTKSTAT